MYPHDQRGERNRQAQARYRARHAKSLIKARSVASMLMKQSWYPSDIAKLARTIRELVGTRCAKDLGVAMCKNVEGKRHR